METDPKFSYYSQLGEQTSARAIPRGIEKSQLETRARRYTLEKQHEVVTEATEIPMPVDMTSTLFEYDITGPRVKSVGQMTGGYLREVAENEAAFAYSLQDAVSLYILQKIAWNQHPLHLVELENIISGSYGWMRVALLIKGGLLDLVGMEVRPTERGLKELEAILTYCKLETA